MELGLGNNKDVTIVKHQLLEDLFYIISKLRDAPML
jgi:hypothetical protein